MSWDRFVDFVLLTVFVIFPFGCPVIIIVVMLAGLGIGGTTLFFKDLLLDNRCIVWYKDCYIFHRDNCCFCCKNSIKEGYDTIAEPESIELEYKFVDIESQKLTIDRR